MLIRRAERVDVATYDVLVRIAGDCSDDAVAAIRSAYKDAVPVRIRDGGRLYKFQVTTHATVNAVRAQLSEIAGVSVVSMLPRRSPLTTRIRRHWHWSCVVSAWAVLYTMSIIMPDNPLEHMNNIQEILLHSAMTMAIAAWAYRSGRKSAQHASRHASASEIAAREASERARRAASDLGNARGRP